MSPSVPFGAPTPLPQGTDLSNEMPPEEDSGEAMPDQPAAATAAPAPKPVTPIPDTPEPPPPTNTVVLQGLNKVTGHISKLEGPIGTVLTFDNLEIITRRCWQSPQDELPENAALLEIRELKKGEKPRRVFMGWMFSSSPGLSGLEHPVYDISIVSCEFRENPEGSGVPAETPAPAPEQPKPAPKKKTKKKQ
jgi:hypothetical protein